MSHARGTLFALVALSTAMVCLGDSRALSLVVSQEQSYFFGTKPANNLLCYTKTISKASALPATVTYTNGNMKNINFVTINADRYSPLGYTVDLTSGQLGTTAISYKLNGPSLLPYAIIVNMYCDP
ncbi:AGAP005695-PA-like protein [Anopheles sinensis]|uniref:AGAP005695-PA-like protein n=1 Tax=Anopheles sinensis TaxID=74873 RepID=A0A084W4C3_ANOSI|nr:AGAP005695-PA-like protein [Anopheles sinensis]